VRLRKFFGDKTGENDFTIGNMRGYKIIEQSYSLQIGFVVLFLVIFKNVLNSTHFSVEIEQRFKYQFMNQLTIT